MPAGARGLEVSLGCLRQDHLVQGQVRDRPPQPDILGLKVLQTLYLIGLQPAELTVTPI